MFRYDQNVPNRHEVPPSSGTEWTSSSSLLATAVTVGTTWERMARIWKNKKSIIISGLLVTALVGSICALFIGRSPHKPDVADGSVTVLDSLTADHKLEGALEPDVVTSAHQKPKKHHRKHNHRQPMNVTTTTEVPPTATVKSAVAEIITRVAQTEIPKSVASETSDGASNVKNNSTFPQSVNLTIPGTIASAATNSSVTVLATPASTDMKNTANTTDTQAPAKQDTCGRNSDKRKKSLVGAESKPAVSVINEVQEKVDFLIEKCKADHIPVFRCTIVLLCDGSRFFSKFATSKRKAKELAARSACEAVYKIKFSTPAPAYFTAEHADECELIETQPLNHSGEK